MDLLFTTGYKVNRIFSTVVSLLAVITCIAAAKGAGLYEIAGVKVMPFVAVGLFLLFNLFLTRKYRRRKKILLTPFPVEWEKILHDKVRYYNNLNNDDQYAFRKRVQVFLGEVRITGVRASFRESKGGRAPVDDETRILIAASAIIPVFRIPDWEYHMLDEVLVYPGTFDEDFNITSGKNDILGMVPGRTSSIIISGKALAEGFSRDDGENVALHEFLHKIDEEDGDIDGIPALFLVRSELPVWKKAVESEIELLLKGKSDLDPYALTDRSEFFAVAGEYFFERPHIMKERHPSLYSIMSGMFRQDLASIISNETAGSIGIKASLYNKKGARALKKNKKS